METCRPHFTHLMTVRRKVESADYRVGIWSLSQHSLDIVFLWVFQLFYILLVLGAYTAGRRLFGSIVGYGICVSDF